MKKLIIAAVVLAGLGGLGWKIHTKAMAGRGPNQRRGGPEAVVVEVSAVGKASLRDIGSFTGTLVPASQFVVAPRVSGRVERLHVNVGDEVRSGQVIAELDDEEYAQQVEQAAAELEVAKANIEDSRSALSIARREYERVQALREKQVASESELDIAKAELDASDAAVKVAVAQMAQKEAALSAARVRLSYTRIAASWEGEGVRVVGERFVDEGAMLSSNSAIASVLDIGTLNAVVYVIERDYSRVSLGQEVVLDTDAFPGRKFAGRIARIAPLLKETSRQARIEIEVPNSDMALKPGMFIRARVEFMRRENVTVVPQAALARRNDTTGVFLVDRAGAIGRFVPVETGIKEPPYVEVREPADLSGEVVTLGQHLLEDGGAIRIAEPAPQADAAATAQAPAEAAE